MSTIAADLAKLAEPVPEDQRPGLPEVELTARPATLEQAAAVLDLASERRLGVLVWGGGTHQGLGGRVRADLVLATGGLHRIVDYQPDDLTVVVEGGVEVGALEEMLAERRHTAVLPEIPGAATVGGVVAAGISGWRRLRYGATRERVLEVTLVTGDGRIVRAGGRVVKNVTGYDLPRLATGSFGALGLIVRLCLKLWPDPPARATVTVADGEAGAAVAYRPLAVVEADGVARVYLAGSAAEVEAQVAALDGAAEEGLQWPAPLDLPLVVSVRVPPRHTRSAVGQLPAGWSYRAAYGVGEVVAGSAAADVDLLGDLRGWAEGRGGALVVVAGPPELYDRFDPWGTPPATLDLQRRIVAGFDPLRVVNPGRPAGGL